MNTRINLFLTFQISRKSCLTGLSQQQLRSLKALQSALVGAGVNLNRPVKIKVEKAPGRHVLRMEVSRCTILRVFLDVYCENGDWRISCFDHTD